MQDELKFAQRKIMRGGRRDMRIIMSSTFLSTAFGKAFWTRRNSKPGKPLRLHRRLKVICEKNISFTVLEDMPARNKKVFAKKARKAFRQKGRRDLVLEVKNEFFGV